MREYKFRGKRLDNGEWVYGYYAQRGPCHFIDHKSEPTNEVDPKTVGQYTGLQDKNGVEIYEGDAVKYKAKFQTGERKISKKRGYDTYAVYDEIEVVGIVRYGVLDTNAFMKGIPLFYVDTEQKNTYETYFFGSGRKSERPDTISKEMKKPLYNYFEYEVVGNEFEHPHLLNLPGEVDHE